MPVPTLPPMHDDADAPDFSDDALENSDAETVHSEPESDEEEEESGAEEEEESEEEAAAAAAPIPPRSHPKRPRTDAVAKLVANAAAAAAGKKPKAVPKPKAKAKNLAKRNAVANGGAPVATGTKRAAPEKSEAVAAPVKPKAKRRRAAADSYKFGRADIGIREASLTGTGTDTVSVLARALVGLLPLVPQPGVSSFCLPTAVLSVTGTSARLATVVRKLRDPKTTPEHRAELHSKFEPLMRVLSALAPDEVVLAQQQEALRRARVEGTSRADFFATSDNINASVAAMGGHAPVGMNDDDDDEEN